MKRKTSLYVTKIELCNCTVV